MLSQKEKNEIKKRLKFEIQELNQRTRESGKADGFEWAKTASYGDLRYAVDVIPDSQAFHEHFAGWNDRLGESVKDGFRRAEWFSDKDIYTAAFIGGAQDLWKILKPSLPLFD